MSKSVLANKVGKMLFNVAKENGELTDVFSDIKTAKISILENKDFIALMNNPNILKEKKVALLDDVFKNINVYVKNVLKILTGNLQILLIKDVEEAFMDIYNAFSKNLVVKVESVYELSSDELDKIKNQLKENLELDNVEITNVVDKSLIGGLKISYNDKVIDASVRTKLNSIRRQLSTV